MADENAVMNKIRRKGWETVGLKRPRGGSRAGSRLNKKRFRNWLKTQEYREKRNFEKNVDSE